MLGKAGTRCSKKKVPWRGRGHLGSTAPQMSECQSSRCKKSRVRVLQISEGSAGGSDSLLCSQAARRKLFWVGAMAVSLLRVPALGGVQYVQERVLLGHPLFAIAFPNLLGFSFHLWSQWNVLCPKILS